MAAYKVPKKDCSVTEGMIQHDINLTSCAQYYIIEMQIDKNSAL